MDHGSAGHGCLRTLMVPRQEGASDEPLLGFGGDVADASGAHGLLLCSCVLPARHHSTEVLGLAVLHKCCNLPSIE